MRRRRFGHKRGSVTQSTTIAKRQVTCRACNTPIGAGDTAVRLRLAKTMRSACTCCGHKRVGLKWYHVACVPADINAAMGVGVNASAPPPPAGTAPRVGAPVAPPPKPMSAEDAGLASLVAFEHALKRRAAGNPKLIADLEAQFKTYQGIKARALRPGTDAEGVTAMKLAMKRAIDLAFA